MVSSVIAVVLLMMMGGHTADALVLPGGPRSHQHRLAAAAARSGDEAGLVSRGEFALATSVAIATTMAPAASASVAEPTASGMSRSVEKEVARKILQIERLNVDSNSNGDKAKHLPQLSLAAGKLECKVPHVMDAERPHFIQYIWLKDDLTDFIFAAKKFEPTDQSPPTLVSQAPPKGTVVTPLAYCNLHGLWIGDSIQVA